MTHADLDDLSASGCPKPQLLTSAKSALCERRPRRAWRVTHLVWQISGPLMSGTWPTWRAGRQLPAILRGLPGPRLRPWGFESVSQWPTEGLAVLHRGRRPSKSRSKRFGEPPASASPSRAIRPNAPPGRVHDRGRRPLYVRAQPETAGLRWTRRDIVREKATAREAGNPQLTGRFRRSWQVLGSNQRRLSRRFYSEPIPAHRNSH